MTYTHDLIVIRARAAGLTAAGGCAMFGLKVALIERERMGRECLNTGWVPSKALIAASARAHGDRGRGALPRRLLGAPRRTHPRGPAFGDRDRVTFNTIGGKRT